MKRKKDICHALEFAKQVELEKPWVQDLKKCEEAFRRFGPILEKQGYTEEAEETQASSVHLLLPNHASPESIIQVFQTSRVRGLAPKGA